MAGPLLTRSAASARVRVLPPSSVAHAPDAITRADVAQACESVGPVIRSAPINAPIQGAPKKLLCCGTVVPKWMPSKVCGSQPSESRNVLAHDAASRSGCSPLKLPCQRQKGELQ